MIRFSVLGRTLSVTAAVAVVALGFGTASATSAVDGEWVRVNLTPEGEASSHIAGTDGHGVAAGYSEAEEGNSITGRLWTDGKLVRSGEPGELFHDVNKSGVVSGAASGEAALWAPDGTKTPLASPPEGENCQANQVNDSGDVAGICLFEGNIRAVRWQSSELKPELLETLEGNPRAYHVLLDNEGNIASSLGPDGSIYDHHPVVWDKNGKVTELEQPDAETGVYVTGLAHGRVFGQPMPFPESKTGEFSTLTEDVKAGHPLPQATMGLRANASSAPTWDVKTGKMTNHELEDVTFVRTANADGVFAGSDNANLVRLWKGGKTIAHLPESDGALPVMVNDAADSVFGTTGGGPEDGHAMQWMLK